MKIAFEIGDIVRMIDTEWHGSLHESRENIGKLYVISEVNGDRYAIRDMETGGESAWWDDSQLEYVSHGEPDIFDKLDDKRNEIIKRDNDLNYIKKEYPNIRFGSWLKLFKEIGFESSFCKNGEYFILMHDISVLGVIFDCIFNRDLDGAMKLSNEIFKENYKENIKSLYYKIWEV